MRTSFHHQPEAQHPNFQLSTSWQADYPIFWSEADMPRAAGAHRSDADDPNVWTRRALQEKTAEPGVYGLAPMYQASSLELMLRTIMEIRARPISLAAMPRRAIWVISSRMRWKDHFSISSISLADLGR